jgi:hypothetical protein
MVIDQTVIDDCYAGFGPGQEEFGAKRRGFDAGFFSAGKARVGASEGAYLRIRD